MVQNLNSPEATKIPSVIPKIYKLKKRKANGKPKSNKDIPNSGEVSNIAGTRPIKALIKAVKISDTIIFAYLHWRNKKISKISTPYFL